MSPSRDGQKENEGSHRGALLSMMFIVALSTCPDVSYLSAQVGVLASVRMLIILSVSLPGIVWFTCFVIARFTLLWLCTVGWSGACSQYVCTFFFEHLQGS